MVTYDPPHDWGARADSLYAQEPTGFETSAGQTLRACGDMHCIGDRSGYTWDITRLLLVVTTDSLYAKEPAGFQTSAAHNLLEALSRACRGTATAIAAIC